MRPLIGRAMRICAAILCSALLFLAGGYSGIRYSIQSLGSGDAYNGRELVVPAAFFGDDITDAVAWAGQIADLEGRTAAVVLERKTYELSKPIEIRAPGASILGAKTYGDAIASAWRDAVRRATGCVDAFYGDPKDNNRDVLAKCPFPEITRALEIEPEPKPRSTIRTSADYAIRVDAAYAGKRIENLTIEHVPGRRNVSDVLIHQLWDVKMSLPPRPSLHACWAAGHIAAEVEDAAERKNRRLSAENVQLNSDAEEQCR